MFQLTEHTHHVAIRASTHCMHLQYIFEVPIKYHNIFITIMIRIHASTILFNEL